MFGSSDQSFLPGPVDNLLLADLDAAGTLEAVTLDDGATQILATFDLTGDGACNTRISTDDRAQLRTLAAADLDGDGRTDLLSITGDQLHTFLPRP